MGCTAAGHPSFSLSLERERMKKYCKSKKLWQLPDNEREIIEKEAAKNDETKRRDGIGQIAAEG
jgi:hypothetical protein